MPTAVLRGSERGYAPGHLTRPGHDAATRDQNLSVSPGREIAAMHEGTIPLLYPANPPRRAEGQTPHEPLERPAQRVDQQRRPAVREVGRRVERRQEIGRLPGPDGRRGQVLLRPELTAPNLPGYALPVPRER